ncbi:MAG TPA: HAMP domain-containing sensor histidine kinase, partial [Chryseosolibacter sp.]|nr:HAMP domain-containing sensor histidine kinase [Chryseosolibacter sp.]
MLYNSARLALFLAAAIAIVTVLFVALFGKGSGSDLVSIFIITSMVGFLVIYFSVDRLIFRPLKNIGRVMDKLTRNEPMEEQKPGSITPLTEVSEQIEAFAAEKQHEIDRLRKQEAFRKDFIADVSHELKTPIFAAQGFVHTLLDGAVKDKAVRGKFLKKAAKSLDGLDILVQDLLTLSQIETGQIKMRFESIDLYALTEEVFEQFRGKSNKKDVILRIEGPV